ncbi:MAG: cytochrome b [Alphaproteobacteria bacterium]|nr:cytochrome b [Alphaproteobacteria bacterium]
MPRRYHGLAITLHWVMAVAFFAMLGSGLAMVHLELDQSLKFQMFQWHKSLGVLLLMAAFLRLSLKLATKQPPLPDSMKPLEKKAAKAGHWAFYGWMLALPIAGWVMVSASPYGLPTIVFGWFEWPHIPGIAANEAIEELAEETHALLAYSFIALIAMHIAAVIKHALVEKENLLPRMGIGKLKEKL